MYKTFNTDADRNDYFQLMADASKTDSWPGMYYNIKYVNGVLYKDDEIITDQSFIECMEGMWDGLNKLCATNPRFVKICGW
jgi:hypothetical protein